MYYTKDISKEKTKRLYLKTNPLENVTLSRERGETICQKIEVDADAVSDLVMTAAG
jgi:hypothetical protein